MARRAWCGTTMLRVSESVMLIVSSEETKVLPWDPFEHGDGADAILHASVELKGFFIEPTEILVGS